MLVWYLIILAVIGSSVKGIFTVVLYRYASTGELPDGFSGRLIDGAAQNKPVRRNPVKARDNPARHLRAGSAARHFPCHLGDCLFFHRNCNRTVCRAPWCAALVFTCASRETIL
jgi:hypothetical protein